MWVPRRDFMKMSAMTLGAIAAADFATLPVHAVTGNNIVLPPQDESYPFRNYNLTLGYNQLATIIGYDNQRKASGYSSIVSTGIGSVIGGVIDQSASSGVLTQIDTDLLNNSSFVTTPLAYDQVDSMRTVLASAGDTYAYADFEGALQLETGGIWRDDTLGYVSTYGSGEALYSAQQIFSSNRVGDCANFKKVADAIKLIAALYMLASNVVPQCRVLGKITAVIAAVVEIQYRANC